MVATIAGPAHADPISAIATVFTAIGASAATAVALAQMTFGLGANLLASAIGRGMAAKPKINVQFDVDFGDDTPLSFIAGDYVTAGKLKYMGTWGKNNRYVTQVFEISALPITGLDSAWFGDEVGDIRWTSPATEQGQLMGFPIKNFSEGSNKERDRAWIKVVNGSQTATDPFLTKVFGTDKDYPWTSAMVGRGKAYVILTWYYDPEAMTSVPTALFKPAPAPMYDPRKDSTAGGSGAHRWGDRATYEATRNPAIIAYNITRGIYFGQEWLFGGRNLPAWRLPRAEWFAAMNACDATVAIKGGTEPAFRCGMQITVDMTAADVLEEIGRAANMRFAEVGGRLKPIVGLPGAAAFAFTDESILITEGQSYKPFNGLGETFNALSATYPEPAEKWSSKDAPEYIDADGTASDGGRYLPTSLSYPAAPFRLQVQRLMRAQMRDYRRMRVHQFHLPPEAYALEPLVDMVSWTSARNGYANKLFVVEQVDPTPGMNVLVTLREVDPGDYDWSSEWQAPVTVIPPAAPGVFIQAVNGFKAEAVLVANQDGTRQQAAIRVSCDGDEVGVTDIHIQARVAGKTEMVVDRAQPFVAPFQWYLTNVLPKTDYEVRVQLVSNLTAKSEWSMWITVRTHDVRVGEDQLSEQLRQNLADGQARIDAAEADAQAAVKEARDAAAAADAAQEWAEVEIQKARDDFAVDIQTSLDAAGQAQVARDAAQVARDQALSGAGAAASSATAADGSAKAAAGSATTARQKATDAGQSVTAAKAEVTKAETARGQAQTFATAASSSATDANTAKTAAQTAQGLAVTAQGKAETASGNAAGSATAAGKSETAAGASATKAETQAGIANTQRLNAETAAARASTSEQNAATAKQDAETASAAAQRSAEMSATIASRGSSVLEDQFLSHPGWRRRNATGAAIVPNMIYPTGNTWQFDLGADQSNFFGADNATGSGLWSGQINAKGYVVEIEMGREGNLSGAGVVLTWTRNNGDESSVQMALADMMAGTNASGQRQMAVGVFPRPSPFNTNGIFSHSVQIAFNDGRFGAWSAKKVAIHRVNIRVATDEELGKGQVAAQVQATLSENYLTKADTTQAIASAETRLNATYGPVSAKVDRVDTALSDLSGGIASIKYVAQAGNANAAGIEAVSIDRNGNKTTSVLRLRGDQVIADGTMNVGALTVGGGVNLLEDATFTEGMTHYPPTRTGPGTTATMRYWPNSYSHPSGPTLFLNQSNADNEQIASFQTRPLRGNGSQPGYPCKPETFYCLSVYSASVRCSSSIDIVYFDVNGNEIDYRRVDSTSGSGSSTNPDTWKRSFIIFQAPSNAAYVGGRFRKGNTSRENSSYVAFWKPQLEETHAAAAQPMPWSSGAVAMVGPDRIFARSMAARHMDTETAVITVSVQIALGIIGTAHIIDGNITNAKIGNFIQSDDFVSGDSGRGWRIRKSGDAEFNNVRIRRQIEVALGTLNVGDIIPVSRIPKMIRKSDGQADYEYRTGADVDLVNGPGTVRMVYTTPIAITEWLGAQRTYLCNVQMIDGTTSKPSNASSKDVYWGWTGDVLPLTLWDTLNGGTQSLRLRLAFWSQNITQVLGCRVRWKIYEVS